jgi:hypothetical protein
MPKYDKEPLIQYYLDEYTPPQSLTARQRKRAAPPPPRQEYQLMSRQRPNVEYMPSDGLINPPPRYPRKNWVQL